MEIGPLKEEIKQAIDEAMPRLAALSAYIHSHPEIGFEEHLSSAAVASALEEGGFTVRHGAFGLATAVDASIGNGPVKVAFCAEYDALPGVGHACGHNLIASIAVGAGLGLAPFAGELGLTVRVLGTPAEEGGGGKILMLDRGAFSGLDAAMMAHPWPEDRATCRCLAVDHIRYCFKGRSAHASASPDTGINAADALVVAQVAIGLLRQQLPAGVQVHGIVEKGGDAANIIPSETVARYMVRAGDTGKLAEIERRVDRCFEAGALATGATLTKELLSPTYADMRPDPELLTLWDANATLLGRGGTASPGGISAGSPGSDAGLPGRVSHSVGDPGKVPGEPSHSTTGRSSIESPSLSTDMANVSHAVPSIHPLIAIEAHGAGNHEPAFAEACIEPVNNAAIRDGAIALAWTAADLAASRLADRVGTSPARFG